MDEKELKALQEVVSHYWDEEAKDFDGEPDHICRDLAVLDDWLARTVPGHRKRQRPAGTPARHSMNVEPTERKNPGVPNHHSPRKLSSADIEPTKRNTPGAESYRR